MNAFGIVIAIVLVFMTLRFFLAKYKRDRFIKTMMLKAKEQSKLFREGQKQYSIWRMSDRKEDLSQLSTHFDSNEISNIHEWAYGFCYAGYSEGNQAYDDLDISVPAHMKIEAAMTTFDGVLWVFHKSDKHFPTIGRT